MSESQALNAPCFVLRIFALGWAVFATVFFVLRFSFEFYYAYQESIIALWEKCW